MKIRRPMVRGQEESSAKQHLLFFYGCVCVISQDRNMTQHLKRKLLCILSSTDINEGDPYVTHMSPT